MFAEPIRTAAFGSITGTYTEVGAPLTNPVRVFNFQNQTDADLLISFNGTDDHIFLPSHGFFVLDITANKNSPSGFFIFSNAPIFVKDNGTPPTTGALYVMSFYGVTNPAID